MISRYTDDDGDYSHTVAESYFEQGLPNVIASHHKNKKNMKASVVNKKKRLSERNSVSHLTDSQMHMINKIIGGSKRTEQIIDEIRRDVKAKKKPGQNQQKATMMS